MPATSDTKAVEQRIEEIRNRLAEITPGPWEVEGGGGACVWHLGSGDTICTVNFDHQTGEHQPGEDQEFIASAPSDIAFLLEQLASIPAQIKAAVQAEREACLALVAGVSARGADYWQHHPQTPASDAVTSTATTIATRIRARGEAK